MVWSAGEAREGGGAVEREGAGRLWMVTELRRVKTFCVGSRIEGVLLVSNCTISFGDLCDAAVQFTVSTKEVYRINNRVVSRVQHDDEQCEFDVFAPVADVLVVELSRPLCHF